MSGLNVGNLVAYVTVDTSQLQQAPQLVAQAMAQAGTAGATAATQSGVRMSRAFVAAIGGASTQQGVTRGITGALNGAAAAATGAGNAMGGRLANGIAPGVQSGVRNGLAGAGAAGSAAGHTTGSRFGVAFAAIAGSAIGTFAGQHLGDVFNTVKTSIFGAQDASAKLTAQLALSADETARFGKDASALYRGGFVDSMATANDAIKSVVQNIGGMRTASSQDLQAITSQVSELAQTMDVDLGDVTKAAGQLMKTGLAKNAQEALDIVAQGFVKGDNKAGDFLDTLNEYGVQFQKLGLNGKDAVGLISQALQGGARDSDVAADGLKEFAIRVSTVSATTTQGFQKLGLNAQAMYKAFGEGGPAARAGLQSVLEKVKGLQDPVSRATVATDLFGTQWEDLGSSLMSFDLNTAAKSLGQVDGAAQKISDTMGGTASSAITSFWHSLNDTATTAAQQLLPALMPLLGTLGDVAGAVSTAVGVFTGLPGPLRDAGLALGGLILLRGPLIGMFGQIQARAASAAVALAASNGIAGAAGVAAGGLSRVAGVLGGPWGLAIATGVTGLISWISSSDDATVSTADFSQAVDEQTGLLTKNAAAIVSKSLSDNKSFDAAKKAGISVGDYTSAVLGNADAQQKVKTALLDSAVAAAKAGDDYKALSMGAGETEAGFRGVIQSMLDQKDPSLVLASTFKDQATAYTDLAADSDNLTQTLKRQAEVVKATADATAVAAGRMSSAAQDDYVSSLQRRGQAQIDAARAMAGALQETDKVTGISAQQTALAYRDLAAAQDEGKAKHALWTQAFKDSVVPMSTLAQGVENAAGSLKSFDQEVGDVEAALDKLAGRTPTAEQASSDLSAAVDDMSAKFKDAQGNVTRLGTKVIDASGKIDTATASGRDLRDSTLSMRDAIVKSATAAENAAGAHGGLAAANAAANAEATRGYDDFIANATAILGSKDAAEKLAAAYGLVPSSVTTQIDADTSSAYAKINSLLIALANLAIQAINIPISFVGGSIPSIPGKAIGGLISGPGSGTSDSIVARLSNGEGVNTAAAMSKPSNVRAMNFMNSGGIIPGFARGGLVGYASGGMVTGGQLAGNPDAVLGDRLGRVVQAMGDIFSEVADAAQKAADAASKAHDGQVAYHDVQVKTTQDAADAQQKIKDAQTKAAENQDAADKRVKDAQDKLHAAQKGHNAGQIASAQKAYDRMKAQQDAVEATGNKQIAAAKHAAQIQSDSGDKQLAQALKVRQNANLAQSAAQNNYNAAKSAQASLQTSYRTLQGLAARYDSITGKLGDARDALSQSRNDKAQTLSGYASSIAGYDGGITGHSDTRTTSGAVVNGLRFDLSKINGFKADIAKLGKEGLSAQLLAQLTSQFGSGGEITAHALAAGPLADIKAANTLQGQINTVSSQAGGVAAGAQFDGTIAKQQRQVNDLVAMQRDTNNQIQGLAKTIDSKVVAALSGWRVQFDSKGIGHLIAPHMTQMAHGIKTAAQRG